MIISDISKRERTRERVMLLAVGGESRRIVLGEVPPIQPEQEQEPAQDVAAQWLQSDDQTTTTTTTNTTKTNRSTPGLVPVPQPRQRIGKFENRVPGNRNRKSRRRRITADV
ncbi:uncharacterized protein LOC124423975 [Vespa crabro]|uniref:uncharacterized protein LOC124423975 n=1 Tax=Vespa crabro TaxID=7445 RepID=UPI001EFFDA0F|nr:uncharacterized protein LOC124423975 [Vespa crabro]